MYDYHNNTFVHILQLLHTHTHCLTVNAMQGPPGPLPGGRLLGLRPDALHLLGAEAQQEDEDQRDQEAGQQQDGHDDHLLLVHANLCVPGSRKHEPRGAVVESLCVGRVLLRVCVCSRAYWVAAVHFECFMGPLAWRVRQTAQPESLISFRKRLNDSPVQGSPGLCIVPLLLNALMSM